MKKTAKIMAIVIAVVLIVVSALALFVKSYLTEERMRAFITETAEKSLNRKVVLGEINVSLFRGVIARNFEIREKDGEAMFLRTKEFILKFQLLPLLSKNLVIDKLGIADAEINVRANPDGTYNFSDIAKEGEVKKEEGAAGLPVNLNVKSISIENARISYTDPKGALTKADAVVNAEMGVTAASKSMLSSEGSIKSIIAQAVLKEKNRTFKDLNADARYRIDLDLDAKKLTIHSVDLNVLSIPAGIKGNLTYAPETAYLIDVSVPDYNLAQFRKDILAAYLPAGTALGGMVSMLLNLNKKPGKDNPPAFNGNVKMSRVSIASKAINLVLDGSVKFLPEIINLEGLRLIAGQNSADITGSVKNYMKYPDVNMKIYSKSILLDELIPAAPAGQQEAAAPAKGEAKKEMEPMDLKMRANVAADIDNTRYKGVTITNFRSLFQLKNNVLSIPYLKGNTLSGAFALKGSVDLGQRGTRYTMNSDLNGVKLEEVTKAFAPKASGKLFGTFSAKADISGRGTLPANVKRNLKGKGEFSVRDGSIRNAELSERFLTILGLQELREIPLDKANGRFTVANGIVNLTTVVSSKDMGMEQKGTIGLDEKLDLSVLVKVSDRLAPKVVSQSQVSKFLSGEKGWTSIPLRVGGTISQPSYGVDTKAIGGKVREGVQKRIGEELQRVLPKPQDKPSGADQQKKPSPRDLLKDIFK